MSFKIRFSSNGLPDDVLAKIGGDEARDAGEKSREDGVCSLWITSPLGVLAYVVFGRDDGGAFVIYYARALNGFGVPIMTQFFGVAQVLGVPMRIHVETVSRAMAQARAMGARLDEVAENHEGLHGVFV